MRTFSVESKRLYSGTRLDVGYNIQVLQNEGLKSSRYPWKKIEEVAIDICDGPRDTNLGPEGIPFISIGDLQQGGISPPEKALVNVSESSERYRLEPHDCLLTKTGDEPRAALVGEELTGAIFSPDIYRLRFNPRKVSPAWATFFFHTQYAAKIFAQRTYGTAIKRLRIADLKKIRIPIPPKELSAEVEALEAEAQENSTAARTAFASTIKALYAEIDHRARIMNTAGESRLSVPNAMLNDRWDVPYIRNQKTKDSLIKTGIFYPIGELAEIVASTRKFMDPEQDICYAQVSDIDPIYYTFGKIRKGKAKGLPDRIRLPIKEYQVLILASGSNLGTKSHPIAIIEPSIAGCLTSNAFMALEFKETPVYYGLVMHHPLVLEQLKGLASGTVIRMITKRQIIGLLLPVLGGVWRQDFNDRARIAWEKRNRAIEQRRKAIRKIDDYISKTLEGEHIP